MGAFSAMFSQARAAPPAAEIDEHGFPVYRPSLELDKWFESLEIPNPEENDIGPYGVKSCCAAGDAYPIKILEDAVPMSKADTGRAVITDPSRKKIITPDGRTLYRYEINHDSLEFRFPGIKVTKERDGNPTPTAWAFLRIQDGRIDKIYCVVPLPPAF